MKHEHRRLSRIGWHLVGVLLLGLTGPLAATPPDTPDRRLERLAAERGAALVRAEYQAAIAALISPLEAVAPAATLEDCHRQVLRLSQLHHLLRSWARAEARDVRRGITGPAAARVVALPLLDALERAHQRFGPVLDELETHTQRVSAAERARAGLTHSPRASLQNDETQVLRAVALLAKLGREVSQVERAFLMAPSGIDGCLTPEQYLAFPHEVDALLGTALPAVARQRSAPTASVLPETAAAARALVTDFLHAVTARDAAALLRLYHSPTDGHALAAQLASANLVSFDLATARFDFRPAGPGALQVRVEGVQFTKQRGNQVVTGRGGKTFLLTVAESGVAILSVGGAP